MYASAKKRAIRQYVDIIVEVFLGKSQKIISQEMGAYQMPVKEVHEGVVKLILDGCG